jgi:uroporphyrinogen decarboxylase
MNSRERVLMALAHKEPDRVPVDFGGTTCSSITLPGYVRLKKYLGIEAPNIIMDRMMQPVIVDERILELFHIDTHPILRNPPEIERNKDVQIDEITYRDRWGVTWHKPPESDYYDMIKPALPGPITMQDVMNHPWPEPHDPGYTRGLRERVLKERASTERALILNLSPGVLQCSQFVRGFEDWFIDLAIQPELMGAIFDAITESIVGAAEDIVGAVGDIVDVVRVGDDIGHQDRLCVRPQMYRELIKPRHAKMMDAIKSRTNAPVVWHTCGSSYDVLEDLFEMGVNAINPVQTSAAKMEPERLKADFGDKLTFWGGIDTFRVLPSGTPEEVAEEVRQKIKVLAPGGGFILNSVHNIQSDVPPENIVVMFEAAQKYGKYPL